MGNEIFLWGAAISGVLFVALFIYLLYQTIKSRRRAQEGNHSQLIPPDDELPYIHIAFCKEEDGWHTYTAYGCDLDSQTMVKFINYIGDAADVLNRKEDNEIMRVEFYHDGILREVWNDPDFVPNIGDKVKLADSGFLEKVTDCVFYSDHIELITNRL